MTVMSATVKSVLSSDTVVLRGRVVGTTLPKERVLRLEGLTAPRLGNRDRADEPWAFESREYLRSLVVGKNVEFSIAYTVNTTTPPLEFGNITLATPQGEKVDVGLAVVKNGWAKVREGGKSGNEDEGEAPSRKDQLKAAEEEARNAQRGLWSASPAPERETNYNMPEDPAAFLAEHKGKPIDAVIEACLNGSTVRARLLLSPTHHQLATVGIAGVRAPRAGSNADDTTGGEEFGAEARFFCDSRLLQRQIKITLLALPTPQAAPVAFGSEAPAPPPASMFLGTVHHPSGNIAAVLLSAGLAKVVDWHAGFLSLSPTPTMMAELRRAEADAKAGRRGLWASLPVATPSVVQAQTQREQDSKFDALVTRIWGADMLSVVKVGEQKERRIQLSSVRQPKPSDPRLAGLQAEGKELMRKKLIGKTVKVQIDYVKPAEGDFEARDCATVRVASGANVAELMVERGLLHVIRHRQGDEQRSSAYDQLMAAEAKAIAESKGVHSGKEFPLPRVIEASESAQKAASFLSSFKRSGKIPAVVDFVAAGSRFKVVLPRQDTRITLVLSNVRCPRTARNASEKSEPYGNEAAAFALRRLMQRDVEVVIEATDKSGGFIGKMLINGEDVATMLVHEGLARVDDYAAERGEKDLIAAQDEAKRAQKNIWSSYDPSAEQKNSNAPLAARKEYVDCVISDIRGGNDLTPFSFAIQILKANGTIPELEKLMGDLTLHHKNADEGPAQFVPKTGELVSAQFSQDNVWYRARVLRVNPGRKEASITFVDYGNNEIAPFSRIRPLAPQFKTLEPQAKEATLSFIRLLGNETEYGLDALDRFRELCEATNPASLSSHESSINVQLVREGYALIDKGSRLRAAYPNVVKALVEAKREAKRSRSGAYELGDAFDDDDD
ncbi:hypothetical protein OIV83_000999 [Microbotryomycetes sp. JL201]|nr:hypothetical protein OIV83_000999 [Microbotryomycetes sp. JL201]